jgi:predicted MFS family arabinose efflux permease
VLLSPRVGRLIDRTRSRGGFVVGGSLLAALAMLIPYFVPSLPGAVVSIALLGLGRAIAVPAQLALAVEVSRAEAERIGSPAAMGVFRLVEQAGNVSGPLVAGGLMAAGGFELTVLGLATINLMALAAFLLLQGARCRPLSQRVPEGAMP